ncbi:MAG: hypothetical protein ACXVCX_05290, partial [Ktedonobacterales bacterium]
MVKKYTLQAHEVRAQILEPVTKLGGQPVWIGEPQWPLSRQLGTPMRFIGQFALDPELFAPCEARMAYLFLTGSETFVDGTWLPDGGENAVILQPGFWDGPAAPLIHGPTLYERIAGPNGSETEEPREYAVTLAPGEDPEVFDEEELRRRGVWDSSMDYVTESKIGGTPT